ncbi:MAG: LAGLIDADG family homing endonuclease, partial [Myxococcota bacterium]
AYFDARRHVEATVGTEKARPDEVYLPGSPEQQYLMQTGRTLFKGMAFDDLVRLQLDIEVYSPEGFPQAEVPEHRVILVALRDSTGWSRLVGNPEMTEAEVLRETLDLVKERDPDVIEGHNCFVPGSLVWTADGPVPVENTEAGCLYGTDGLQAAPPFVPRHHAGEVVTLDVERGGTLTTTPDHPHLVARSEETRWTAAGDIAPGDYVAGPRRLRVPPVSEPFSCDDFYAAGLVWSDGHMPPYPNLVWFSNTEPALLDWMRSYMGPGRFEKHRKPAKPQHAPLSRICLSSPLLRDQLLEIGVPIGNKLETPVDFRRVLRAPDAHVRAFLCGVIDGDGHVQPDGILIASASPTFRAVLRQLAMRFGLQSTETRGGVKLYPTENSFDDFDQLTAELRSPKKRVRADRSRAIRDDLPPEVSRVLKRFFRGRGDKAAGVWGLDHSAVPLPHTTLSYVLHGRTRLSRRTAQAIIETVERHISEAPPERQEDWRAARRLIDGLSALSWYRVRGTERHPYDGPVYNTTTPDHTYIVDGHLTHNCLGFDFPYLFERCRRHSVPVDLGRDGSAPRTFPTSMRFAERQVAFEAVEIAGRHVIDTLHQTMAFDVFARDLPNYTLKGVARYFGFAPE